MLVLNNINLINNQTKISIVILFISIMAFGLIIQSQQNAFALDIEELGDIDGLPYIGLSNTCVAFECNNKQSIDNSKTISGNTNSNIISESDNTNIGELGNSSQLNNQSNDPNPPTCLECFDKSHLTSFQLESIFEAYGVSSLAELCAKLQGTNSQEFFSRMGILGITIDSNSFLQSGIFAQ